MKIVVAADSFKGSMRSGDLGYENAVAARDPVLFRETLDFSRGLYETERRTYHVTAELDRVPAAGDLTDSEMLSLLDDDRARRVLHVTFGRVLTENNENGSYLFKDRLLASLGEHESTHFDYLVAHFRHHTAPFGGAAGEGR